MGGMLFIFLVYLFVVEMRRSSLRGSSVAKVNVNYNWDAMSMMILFI
jgi:hypothetical protein